MSLYSFFQAYEFPVVSTRAANVYGPGQQLYRIIPRTALFIKLKRKLQLHGGGISTRSFIHIGDVSEATLQIARKGTPGEIYHLATGKTISIRSLVELICSKMRVSFEGNVEMAEERLGKDAAYLLDSNKARETFGWSDEISLEQGIDEIIEWVESNFAELKTKSFDYVHKA